MQLSKTMKRFSMLGIFLVATLAVSACAGIRPPAPGVTESPISVATPTSPAATPTGPTATPSPAAIGVTGDAGQPVATDVPPTPVATQEFDIRSGKLLAAAELRARADAAAQILGEKPADSIVVVTGASGDWYEIVSGLANDGHAWLPKSAITFELTSPTATPAATATPEPTAAPAVVAAPATAVPAPTQNSALDGLLVFQDSLGGTIYLMNADGSGLRALTTGLEPALSPDGSQVAFARWDEPRGLWLINTDGSNERLVYGANRVRSPSWTPDGQSVVFERSTGSKECRDTPFGCLPEDLVQQVFGGEPCIVTQFGTFCVNDYRLISIWTTGITRYNLADGSNRDLPTDSKATAPQVAPGNGEFIFLDSGGFSANHIEGNDPPWPVVQEKVPLGPVSYSPDDQYLYATRHQHDHWQIWRWRIDGSQPTPLTVPDPLGVTTSNNVAPSISPDGKSVVFLTDRTGAWEMWVMNTDGSNQRPLAPDALAGVNFRYDFNSDRTVDWGS